MFIALDQYGSHYKINKHPRKELMEMFCRSHVSKMYVDTKEGRVKHIGYIIAGHWLEVFKLTDAFAS